MPQLTRKPLNWFKRDPNQPRKTFGLAELQFLGASLRIRQNDPVQAKSDGTLIDGERRFRAAKAAGLKELDVIICDEKLTDCEIATLRLTSFFHREGLTHHERWKACSALMEANGWDQQTLAAHLHLDPGQVSRILAPSKCTEEWQNALRDGTVGISDCYAASKLPLDQQAGLLVLKLGGASRDQLEKAGKQIRKPAKQTERLARVRLHLPSKACVVITGEGLSLEDVADALTEAQKEVRRARDQGSDIKALNALMNAKAKKGD